MSELAAPVEAGGPPYAWQAIEAPRSLRRTLGAFSAGRGDPTTWLSPGRFVFATLTPDGPATVLLRWTADPAPVGDDGLDAEAWGPGAGWLLDRVDALTGAHDRAIAFDVADPVVTRALSATRTTRIGATGTLWHHLLPTVIAQRITGGEAARQWAQLCRCLGEVPPGPDDVVAAMRLPPSPESLRRRPAWWFHRLGIETKRARAITEVAAHADRLWSWSAAGPEASSTMLQRIPGIGPWTVGSALGPALGDTDAVPVGDFHIPHAIAWALAGEPRATDERMLELLAPYHGQRGRVAAAVVRTNGTAPKFGPRRRIMNIQAL
jgi:3-methyladenine DNA glycosylase/8-oxoguanine DNA glycosylase